MKALMTYYGRDLKAKIKVVPHSWASGIVVLTLYAGQKFWLLKRWKFVDSMGIDWPENEGIMRQKVNELFNKYKLS